MRRLPLVLLVASCALLVLGVLPGAPAGGLIMLGVRGDTALVVGRHVGVGVTLVGLGLLLAGMGMLLRQNRLDLAWSSYRRAMEALAIELRAVSTVSAESVLRLTCESEGLTSTVRVDLAGEGEVSVHTTLPQRQRFEVRRRVGGNRPQRLEHRLATAGLEEVAVGDRWVARSDGGPRVVQVVQTPALVRAVDGLFSKGAVRSFGQDGASAVVRIALVRPGHLADVVHLALGVLISLKEASE